MFWRRRDDRELDRDIDEHIAFATEENIARGMSREEARYAALRRFGNIARVKEDTRGVWVWTWLETLAGDVRHAMRRIRRSPGTSAVVVLSLALAFLPNVALFSVFDRMLLTPLPVARPEEIVELVYRNLRPGANYRYEQVAFRELEQYAGMTTVSGLAYHRRTGVVALVNGRPAMLWGAAVNPDYFRVLEIPLRSGPGLVPGRRSAVISHSLWEREFASRADIIGQTLLVSGEPWVIDGVTAAGFRGVERQIPTDVWLTADAWMVSREDREGRVWARLRPGVRLAQVQGEAAKISEELAREWPASNRGLVGTAYNPIADRERSGVVMAGVGVLLLSILLGVACANVAGVLLARGEERRQETAIRQSLGAPRGRLVREWMIESLLLASAAAVLGCVGAWVVLQWLPSLPFPVAVPLEASMGVRVWIYAAGMMVLSAVAFGLLPAWRSSRPDLVAGLRRDAAVSLLRVRVPVRSLLLIAQIAAAQFLLFFAGLSMDALGQARQASGGMDRERRVAVAMLLPKGADGSRRELNLEDLRERLVRMPGVRSAAYGHHLPLSGVQGRPVKIEGGGGEPVEAFELSAGAGFLPVLGVGLLSGRDLGSSSNTVLVSRRLAQRLDSTELVVGRQIRVSGRVVEVGGVLPDGLWGDAPRVVSLLPRRSSGEVTLAIEVAGDPSQYLETLRRELRAAAPGTTVLFTKTLRQHCDDALFVQRFSAELLYGLGLLAVALTMTGLHGITTALFLRRSKEFAIRLAVGARPVQLLRPMLRGTAVLTTAGAALGLAVAAPVGLLAARAMPGVSLWSVYTFVLGPGMIVACVTLAALHPASRVLRLQASEVLRTDSV